MFHSLFFLYTTSSSCSLCCSSCCCYSSYYSSYSKDTFLFYRENPLWLTRAGTVNVFITHSGSSNANSPTDITFIKIKVFLFSFCFLQLVFQWFLYCNEYIYKYVCICNTMPLLPYRPWVAMITSDPWLLASDLCSLTSDIWHLTYYQ